MFFDTRCHENTYPNTYPNASLGITVLHLKRLKDLEIANYPAFNIKEGVTPPLSALPGVTEVILKCFSQPQQHSQPAKSRKGTGRTPSQLPEDLTLFLSLQLGYSVMSQRRSARCSSSRWTCFAWLGTAPLRFCLHLHKRKERKTGTLGPQMFRRLTTDFGSPLPQQRRASVRGDKENIFLETR